MSHFEKIASVLAFAVTAFSATGCLSQASDSALAEDECAVEVTPQGGFQEGFQKGGVQQGGFQKGGFEKGFQKGLGKGTEGGGYFGKVPATSPNVGYGQPTLGQGMLGQPGFGQGVIGQPGFGQSLLGQPGFGQGL